ncbi:MAG TPA: ADP-ribosylglycohydrolase family protein, partial [Candidatus Baltobacteraceae bacterium]|nr:ADP-ribosylglycohydrolase family protein [Candidatus Baltobacteraceae bacterium]
IGSVFEGRATKSKDFPIFTSDCVFTDDTVMTTAVANSILRDGDYVKSFKHFGRKYPGAGYGGSFFDWIHSAKIEPYFSFGNGSAMRVSPIGFAFNSIEEILREAKKSADVTHNHPEGVKGAQAVALAIFLARQNQSKAQIKREISERFGYDLNRTLEQIRPGYYFDVTCQGSVPESIIAFLESENYEDAVRKAVSLGGDADTMACIAGGIAQAFYKSIPLEFVEETRSRLPADLLSVMDEFNQRYGL